MPNTNIERALLSDCKKMSNAKLFLFEQLSSLLAIAISKNEYVYSTQTNLKCMPNRDI